MAKKKPVPHGAAVGSDFQGPTPAATATPNTGPPADTAAAPPDTAADWYKAFFSQYGLPADVQQQITSLLSQYATDPSTALTLAQQYLRSTQWWQQTFPGFNQGVANGLFTDETGYRSYLNNVNQAYNQYLGRHVSGDELQQYITAGYSPDHVGRLLGGSAWAKANANDVASVTAAFGEGSNSAITGANLQTLGQEQAGIDTAGGQTLENILKRAQQRMAGVFNGVLARPSLSLGPNGISAPGLGGQRQTPDVAA